MRNGRSVRWMFHPSDFANDGDLAFVHALKMAVSARCGIGILNAVPDATATGSWGGFPGVRKTLEKWGLLPDGSVRADVPEKLGVPVTKILVEKGSPKRAIEEHLEKHGADFMVLATEGREGIPRWLKPSVAETVARKSRIPTLFVPKDARGFVSAATGELSLRRILLPVDRKPDARPAMEAITRLLQLLDLRAAALTVLHVGNEADPPAIDLPTIPSVTVDRLTRQGSAVEEILSLAEDRSVDLIVMATAGHEGFLDAFRGSTSEQVLRGAPCPVMAVPSV